MSKTVCRLSQQGQGLIASFLTDPIQPGCATHKDALDRPIPAPCACPQPGVRTRRPASVRSPHVVLGTAMQHWHREPDSGRRGRWFKSPPPDRWYGRALSVGVPFRRLDVVGVACVRALGRLGHSSTRTRPVSVSHLAAQRLLERVLLHPSGIRSGTRV